MVCWSRESGSDFTKDEARRTFRCHSAMTLSSEEKEARLPLSWDLFVESQRRQTAGALVHFAFMPALYSGHDEFTQGFTSWVVNQPALCTPPTLAGQRVRDQEDLCGWRIICVVWVSSTGLERLATVAWPRTADTVGSV